MYIPCTYICRVSNTIIYIIRDVSFTTNLRQTLRRYIYIHNKTLKNHIQSILITFMRCERVNMIRTNTTAAIVQIRCDLVTEN